jgi:hypothetical protein
MNLSSSRSATSRKTVAGRRRGVAGQVLRNTISTKSPGDTRRGVARGRLLGTTGAATRRKPLRSAVASYHHAATALNPCIMMRGTPPAADLMAGDTYK